MTYSDPLVLYSFSDPNMTYRQLSFLEWWRVMSQQLDLQLMAGRVFLFCKLFSVAELAKFKTTLRCWMCNWPRIDSGIGDTLILWHEMLSIINKTRPYRLAVIHGHFDIMMCENSHWNFDILTLMGRKASGGFVIFCHKIWFFGRGDFQWFLFI